jgi:hypothetical protein
MWTQAGSRVCFCWAFSQIASAIRRPLKPRALGEASPVPMRRGRREYSSRPLSVSRRTVSMFGRLLASAQRPEIGDHHTRELAAKRLGMRANALEVGAKPALFAFGTGFLPPETGAPKGA